MSFNFGGNLKSYLLVGLQEHLQDLLSEEEQIKSTKDPNSFVDVVVCFWVKPQSLRQVLLFTQDIDRIFSGLHCCL